MFLIIKKKWIICVISVILIAVVTICLIASYRTVSVNSYSVANAKYTVVIDAGHGGIDGGSVGKQTGAVESELNLAYAKNLAKCLNNMGINVVLTRKDANGLYDESAPSLKKSDMKKRKEIIETTNPTLIVSIHMNSFSSPRARGAQTFYKKDNEQGKILAEAIQTQLKQNIEYGKESCKVGDYYILNCTDIPSVLVECGFLSNAEDEELLVSADYQNKICYSILSGIIAFLNYN